MTRATYGICRPSPATVAVSADHPMDVTRPRALILRSNCLPSCCARLRHVAGRFIDGSSGNRSTHGARGVHIPTTIRQGASSTAQLAVRDYARSPRQKRARMAQGHAEHREKEMHVDLSILARPVRSYGCNPTAVRKLVAIFIRSVENRLFAPRHRLSATNHSASRAQGAVSSAANLRPSAAIERVVRQANTLRRRRQETRPAVTPL
jgi:hypothetical protein